ncbi:ran guanine nucleotide release factor isoform X1 [Denticeps clupeoides]|uniref:Ran guanine nucleotide release factor n=1 Tax=Denticeps clupeoides TaxID=299321 RepID=A0AAY4EFQ0_9TELE|nr:ran guanine nucleotide release factor isoform X1 [Denticeps clupeoides]
MLQPLFGGALSACVPHGAQDVSELRQVPDNQEVFAHRHTDQSIVVELLEHQGHVEDEGAARYHFEDLAESNHALDPGSSEVSSVEPLPKTELSMQQCASAWLLTGTQRVSKFDEKDKNQVNIVMCLFRLPQFSTDVLVTFNDPVVISPLSSSAAGPAAMDSAPWTLENFQCLLRSVRLLDPGVFG